MSSSDNDEEKKVEFKDIIPMIIAVFINLMPLLLIMIVFFLIIYVLTV